jgi:energy-coupling factor transport system ATP-binding protein
MSESLMTDEPIIRLENVSFSYGSEQGQAVAALQDINLVVQPGEYLVILGHNGSGKSTLAKHLNALLLPTEGNIWVKGWNTRDRRHVRDIRSTVGMVFQIPDNQIVATIVEEDVAFGPENLGLPHPEIVRRVDWSLGQVDMLPLRHRAPHLLSGGQKQRVCIAGMLAMKPEVLVLDEATAMLDPLGRREVLETVSRLNKQEGVTVIAITHYMEEAVAADRLVVLAGGRIALQGTPREVFSQVEALQDLQIDVPQITQLATALNRQNGAFPQNVLTTDEFVSLAGQKISPNRPAPAPVETLPAEAALPTPPPKPIIQVKDLTYYYMYDTPLQVKAVDGVSLEVYEGEILGIIGHTGSGKSTVIQHFNALLRPHQGQVKIFGQDVNEADLDVKSIRRRVGLVFQSPEAQLFEQYVGDDIAYGPRNLKLSREEVRERVRQAMEAVGLGFEAFKDRVTFSLSGGEMRRVALAGVLALQPEALVLDEPTAGLDPQGRRQLLDHILKLQREQGLTLVLISHNMEELAQVCQRVCVISEGKVVITDTPSRVFGQPDLLRTLGLDIPPVTEAIYRLQQAGLLPGSRPALSVSQALDFLSEALHERI